MKKIILYPMMMIILIISVNAFSCYSDVYPYQYTGEAIKYNDGNICVEDTFNSKLYSCQGTIYLCPGVFYDDYYCELGDIPDYVQCQNGCDAKTGLCSEGRRICNEKQMICDGNNVQICENNQWKTLDRCDTILGQNQNTHCQESSSTYAFCEPNEEYRTNHDSICLRNTDSISCEPETNGGNFYKCYDNEKTCLDRASENRKLQEKENQQTNMFSAFFLCIFKGGIIALSVLLVPAIWIILSYSKKRKTLIGVMLALLYMMFFWIYLAPLIGLIGVTTCFNQTIGTQLANIIGGILPW